MKGKWLAVLCGGMVLAGAAPAHALKAHVDYDSLVISAAPGERNILTVRPDPAAMGPTAFLIADAGGGVATQAGPGCTKTLRVIRCELSYDYPTPSLSLSLNDRNDSATVIGGFYYEGVDAGAGDDTLDLSEAGSFGYGGAWITGGAGADEIDTRNGATDTVDCGTGPDTAEADEFDWLNSC